MPRDGSGSFNLVPGVNPVVPGTKITSDWANETLEDVAAGLSQSISRDGQTIPTSNLPMSGFRHVQVGDPTDRNQYATLGVVQDGRAQQVNLSGGSGNSLQGSMAYGTLTTYSPGQLIWFRAIAENTGPVTVNIDGVGARTLLNRMELPLQEGDLVTDDFYYALFDDTVGAGSFVLLTATSGQDLGTFSTVITGSARPAAGTYPTITVTATHVTVPAGEGTIVPPVISASTPVLSVTWPETIAALTNLTTAASTTLAFDSTGALFQFPGRVAQSVLREYIVVGYLSHLDAIPPLATTAPAIKEGDAYLFRDATNFLENNLVSGGRISRNAVNLVGLDVSDGLIIKAGGSANTDDAPNLLEMPGATASAMFHYRGNLGSNFGASVLSVDTANYDPNHAANGALVAIPANNYAFHRVFWLYGRLIIVYGQKAYSGTIAEAMSFYDSDNGKYINSPVLSDATFLGTILVKQGSTNIDNDTTGVVIPRGAPQFGIAVGSTSGFADAPADGSTYGRRNNAWSTTIASNNPVMTGTSNISGAGSKHRIQTTTTAAGGLEILNSAGTRVATILFDPTSGSVNFDSYSALNVLVSRWSWDVSDGSISVLANLLSGSTFDGDTIGDVTGPNGGVVDGQLAAFDGTTGKLIEAGPRLQSSALDATAGRVLLTGAFGLGGTAALHTPRGTTAQRVLDPGDVRYNTDLRQLEWDVGGEYLPIYVAAPGAVTGCSINAGDAPTATTFTVLSGAVNETSASGGAVTRGVLVRNNVNKIIAPWSAGLGGGCLATTGIPVHSGIEWWGIFVLWDDNNTYDIGADLSPTGANILTDSGYTYARRIGWMQTTSAARTAIVGFRQDALGNYSQNSATVAAEVTGLVAGTQYTVSGLAPPNVAVDVVVQTSRDSGSTTTLYGAVGRTSGFVRTPSSTDYDMKMRNFSASGSQAETNIRMRFTEGVVVRNAYGFYLKFAGPATCDFQVSCRSWLDDRTA